MPLSSAALSCSVLPHRARFYGSRQTERQAEPHRKSFRFRHTSKQPWHTPPSVFSGSWKVRLSAAFFSVSHAFAVNWHALCSRRKKAELSKPGPLYRLLMRKLFYRRAHFAAYGKTMTAFRPSWSKNPAAVFRGHPLSESVLVPSFSIARLKCSFHRSLLRTFWDKVKNLGSQCSILYAYSQMAEQPPQGGRHAEKKSQNQFPPQVTNSVDNLWIKKSHTPETQITHRAAIINRCG